ncbi:hypothetical protein MUY27_00670 [Mucilaginibacter sp. RS28]|uniref:Uncharacterized protein n=1 Tax=Mucilaginibacter straminoryzae TaxID=2932774 RepID=A0A9X1X263_9SPHI|nr:hypothetical protein [Mucilaginibacter straminoryzae]MCJ8208198.1 hypothetical protein [Mucilaginibacter straminoryzae]
MIQGKNKKTNACIDWYWQTYIDGELVSEEYVFTTCEGEEVECDAIGQRDRKGILKIKMACGGNQGGGDDPNTVLLDSINAKPCNAMTYADQMDYIQTISNMNNGNCLQKALLHAFNDLGKQVTVCKGSTVNGAIAQTDYYSNTITWNSNLSFYEKTLDEEFFHNIQFGTYGNVNDHANIEFEAAIMCDMIQTSANYTAMDQQSTSVRNEYSTWLKSITNNGNSFPKSFTEMFPDDTAKQTYFYFLEKYRDQYQPGDSHYSPINYNLLPTAIFKVTSKSCN